MWNPDRHRQATFGSVSQVDTSFHSSRKLACDGQSEARAASAAAPRVLDARERLEHFGQLIFGNARAVVINAHDDVMIVTGQVEARTTSVADAVLDDVAQQALEFQRPGKTLEAIRPL